jgi:hypothetical protein
LISRQSKEITKAATLSPLHLPFRHIGGGRDEKFLRLFEIARVLVRFDHIARFIVNTKLPSA